MDTPHSFPPEKAGKKRGGGGGDAEFIRNSGTQADTDECTRKFAVPSLARSSQFQVAFIVPSPYNFAHRAKTLYYMQQCRGKHHYFQIGYLNCRKKKEKKKRKPYMMIYVVYVHEQCDFLFQWANLQEQLCTTLCYRFKRATFPASTLTYKNTPDSHSFHNITAILAGTPHTYKGSWKQDMYSTWARKRLLRNGRVH